MTARLLAVILVCTCLWGCGESPTVLPPLVAGTVEVRDSAGIRIASNSGGVWTEVDAWRVRPRPILRLGEAMGADEETFYGLGDAARAPDGRLAVLNRGSHEVRIYSDRGRHLRTFGRQGEGPGEFLDLGRLEWVHGDSLLVWDQGLGRTYVFSDEGSLGRAITFPLDRPPMRSSGERSWGRISAPLDGRVRGSSLAFGGTWFEEVESEEWVLAETELIEFAADGSEGASWGVFPVRATYFNQNGEQPVHFGARSGFSLHEDRLYFTDARDPEVRVYEPAGDLAEIVRVELESRPVTPDDLARFKTSAIEEIYGTQEGSSAGRRQWGELLDEIPSEEEMPYFSDLVVDSDGNIWLESFSPPWESPAGWLVLDPTGQLLGRVAIPDLDRVFEIGDTWILGLEKDSDDVERLVMLEIIKP